MQDLRKSSKSRGWEGQVFNTRPFNGTGFTLMKQDLLLFSLNLGVGGRSGWVASVNTRLFNGTCFASESAIRN